MLKKETFFSNIAILGLALFICQHALAYNIRHISGKDGLTNSSVLSLAQLPNGIMLFGTVDGLHSYDGIQVCNFMLNSGQYLRGNLIEDVLCTNDQKTWVLTNYGLNIVDNEKQQVEFYDQFQGLRSIRKSANGKEFMLGEEVLHYQDANGALKRIALLGVIPDDVKDYTFTDQYLYIFHKKGISKYAINQSNEEYILGEEQKIDNTPIISANGENYAEYIVDDQGILYRFDLKTGYKRELSSLSQEIATRGDVSDIVEFKGKLFIAFYSHGVIVLDLQKNDNKSTDLGIETGVFRMLKDRYGDIVWIGTDGQGVYMYCDEPFSIRTFTNDNTSLSCPVRAVLKDITGTLWVGTKGDGLMTIPNFVQGNNAAQTDKYFINESNSELNSNIVYALAESGDQGIWICGANGLNYYSYASKKIHPVNSSEPLQQVVAAQEYNGELWIATLGFGIFRANINFVGGQPHLTNIKNYLLDNGKISSNYFFCIAHDKNGKWWCGNRGKGLFQIDQNEKLKHIELSPNFTNPCINDIFSLLPIDDNLWIGTGCGIVVVDNQGNMQLIDISHGLPGNTIHALISGTENDIWATTNAGIVTLSTDKKILRVYGRKGSLDVTEFSDGAASRRDNELYFGGVNGFAVISQDSKVQLSERPTELAFTTFSINGVQQNISEYLSGDNDSRTLTLSYQQNSFRLGVGSLNYISEPFNNYYYQLSGDDEWCDNGQNNIFSFIHLPIGEHTLYIKYKNLSTGTESDTFSLFITITPPWYLSTWAYICYALALIGMIYGYAYNWRRKQKEKQAAEVARLKQIHRDELYEEKLKFLTNVVHELNTPLTLIYGPCERILTHEADNQFVKKYIQQIIRNLSRLNSLIQEIIDFRKVTTGHHVISIKKVEISALIIDYFDAFADIATRHNINYEKDLEEGIVWNSDEKAVIRIVSNLISNAFKYTKSGGTIKVKLAVVDNNIVFSVYNTGVGISEEDQKRVFDYYSVFNNVEESQNGEQTSRNGIGMAICHNMVKQLGGDIKIESEVGKYTHFIVTLPQRELPQNAPNKQETIATNVQYLQQLTTQTQPIAEKKADNSKPKRLTGENMPTILVIDDHQDILDLISESLEGYHLITAHNGDEGFEKLKNEQPDLIITDLMMPGIDGLDFIQQVKQNKHTMHIPLIILSAKSSEEERIEGLESGADVYISKPFSIAYLQATINRLLENRTLLKEYYNSSASAYSYSSGKLISKESQEFIETVIQLIDKNLSDADYTPEVLAEQLNISQRNLYRKFENAQLPTPKEYIKTYKINAAARLLTTTGMTIQEIIYATGFNTRSQFYTEFRKHFNQTPKDYREQYKFKDESLS